jgi:hypothetical protein
MEIPKTTIQTDDKDTYAFHLSLFGALCRTLSINGIDETEIAGTFGIPESILLLFTPDYAPMPTLQSITSSADIAAVRYYPPFSYMNSEAFEDYRSKVTLLKKALEEEP